MSRSSVTEVNEEGYELQVTLVKQRGTCGFSFAHVKPTADSDQYVYVIQYLLSENARKSLSPGDRLLSVNGKTVLDKNREEVAALFNKKPTSCDLVLWRPTLAQYSPMGQGPSDTPPWLKGVRERELSNCGIDTTVKVKKKNGSLGIKITSYENPVEYGLSPSCNFYITEIRSDYTARYLCVGDKLLKINGQTVEHMTHADVIRMLTSSPTDCVLEVSRSAPISVPGDPPPSYDELTQWDVTNTVL